MLDKNDVLSTVQMIDRQHLDIRTITMGISLLSCADRDAKAACEKIYDKITRYAEGLVKTGEDIEREFGIPIVNKRISVTPIALVASASETEDYVPFAVALDRAAKAVGVNFIGGFSALVQKGTSARPRPASTWTRWRSWAAPSRPRRSAPPTAEASAARSSWCSATLWRTTPLWPARSTASVSRSASSTSAFPAPAWYTMPCKV